MDLQLPKSEHPRIVIVGGGFGGIELAKSLKNKPFQIVMLDKHNYHTFQPLLYQVATGGLEPDSIAFPLRKIFKGQKNLIFRVAKVNEIQAEAQKISADIGDIHFDYLVLATGSTTNYFGNNEIAENTMPMKSIPEALDLRSMILQDFEQALIETNPDKKTALLNFVVVGGGPTGVETAGALVELKKNIIPKDYPELDISKINIYLIENSPHLLGAMSPEAQKKSKEFLIKMGVNVMNDTRVLSYDGFTLSLQDNPAILATTVIWSAGVKGEIIPGLEKAEIVRGGRIKTDEHNKVAGYENIYAIGDVAAVITDDTPNGHPGVAPAAIQQGKHLAENFANLIDKKPLEKFKYFDKGAMATVGRNKAVVDIGKIRFQGIFAWFTWMFVHLMTLVGFRNKIIVFINWVWSYFSYDRGTRLIIRTFKKQVKHKEEAETVAL